MIHVNITGMHIIYLNSCHDATNLLGKRSLIYSDRIHTSMLKLMNIGDVLSLTRYGDAWKERRKIFRQDFNTATFHRYMDTQLEYARSTLKLIQKDPIQYENHIKYFSSGIILKAVYGYEAKTTDDSYIRLADEGLKAVEGLIPGQYLVDAFPIMMHLPEWLPGTGFKEKARAWGKQMMDVCKIPFEDITKSFLEGTAVPSFTTSWLSKISCIPEEEERKKLLYAIQVTAGTTFLAGKESTAYTLHGFISLISKHPEAQLKAQEELDRVIGRDRLPDFKDKDSLPYIEAFYKEALRMNPIPPLIPHSVTQDDEYKGMLIPKGSAILANTWAMSRNVEDYGPDSNVFRPERFLENELRHPAEFVFGFGRRMCPGRKMAENSIFIAISSILHVFRVGVAVNEEVNKSPIDLDQGGSNTYLTPNQVTFELRFEGAENLIDAD